MIDMKKIKTIIILCALTLTLGSLLCACGTQDTGPDNAAPSAGTPVKTDDGNISDSAMLQGTIETMDDNSFVINESFIEVDDNGAEISYSSLVDKFIVTVQYDDSTEFILRRIVNGGIDPSDVTETTASKDDLQIGASVSIEGSDTDSCFFATKIIINHYPDLQ